MSRKTPSQTDTPKSPRAADVSTAQDEQGPPTLPSLQDNGPDSDRIARRAYELYEARGGDNGRDMDDWLEAERELRGGEQDKTQRER